MKPPEPTDPEELEAEREIAEERDAKYGGHDRWFLSVMSLLCAALAFTHGPLTILFVVMAALLGVWAIVNWHSWLRLSPAARAAKRAAYTKSVAVPHAHTRARPARPDPRRLFDVVGLVAFPLVFTLFVFSRQRPIGPVQFILIALFIGVGCAFYYDPDPPDKRDPDISPSGHHPDDPEVVTRRSVRTTVVDFVMILTLPISFLAYFLSLVWLHRSIPKHEVMILVVVIPLVVAAFSWGVKIRLQRHKAEIGRQVSKIYGWTVLALWAASVFILAILIVHLFQ